MSDDKTMKIVTNLDRAGVEQKLAEVRGLAQAKNLAELAALFTGVDGMPKAQIEQRIGNALKWLADKPQHMEISAQLEMVELNLRNL
jgi:hypothetical protein